jgi:hypothetical protein
MTSFKFTFTLLLLLLVGCNSGGNQPSSQKTEDYDEFIDRFYSDSVFQQSRVSLPLDGKILEWDNEEDVVVESNWLDREPEITGYETVKVTVEGSLQSFIRQQDSVVESIYLENSGFLLVRTFVLKSGCWYLTRYDISYL